MRCPVPRERASQRILIVKFGALGDILMATPMLTALRQAHPDAYLTWLVEHTNVAAIEANPYVDEVIVWNGGFWKNLLAKRWKNMLHRERLLGAHWLRQALKFWGRLRRCRYDIVVSLHPEEWPSLVWATGAATKIGIFEEGPESSPALSPWSSHLYTQILRIKSSAKHRTEIYLSALTDLGLSDAPDKRLTLGYTQQDAENVDQFLSDLGVSGGYVVIAPKTTAAARCWLDCRFAQFADRVASATGRRVIFIGSANERAEIERIACLMTTNAVRAAGIFSFRESAALLDRASLLVTGDTAPLHMAGALGVPYLALFGSSPVSKRAPVVGQGVALQHPVPCGPCDKAICPNSNESYMLCMRLISVDEALEAALAVLSESGQRQEAPPRGPQSCAAE